jgi:3-oxoacyl-[acyl-carrier protein] reductase
MKRSARLSSRWEVDGLELQLQDKVAWVLGASSGIGRACARSLAAEGASVVVSARREDALKEAADEIASSGGRCVPVPLDVTDAEGIRTAAQRIESELGRIDILVGNAGGPPGGTFEDIDEDTFKKAFELTLASAWRLAKAVVPGMKARGSGVLIFITSSSTKEVIPSLLLSNTMRAGVVGLAKTLSKELGPHGIRVMCVAPGRVDTARIAELAQATAKKEGITLDAATRRMQESIPLGRYASPQELGDVVAFLASERASYVTGINVLVDGGMVNTIAT